jgi:hypothetical protein
MSEGIPNFVYGAICCAKSRYPSASAPRFNCFTPAKAYVADCWVCDAFGRMDPGLNTSLIPVRKEDFADPHHQQPPKRTVDVTVTL